MKITIVNKFSNTGGAAIAAKRLYEALKDYGIEVTFLVQQTDDAKFETTTNSKIKNFINFIRFSAERLKVLIHIKDRKNLFTFDSASFGEDISNHPAIKNADIIHLHWINFGFLSLKSLEKLLKLNKPIVWTFHDMWTFTGGCFYSHSCENYKQNCQNCPILKNKSKLAENTFNKKKKLFSQYKFHIVALSKWIGNLANESELLKNMPVNYIPNPIDIDVFKPYDKNKARKELNLDENKFLIGFVAYNVKDERKGAKYLKESLLVFLEKYPEQKSNIELIAIGKINDTEFFDDLPVKFTGYVKSLDKLIKYYNSFDLMILPSLEDNVPLVIQEAMACETPFIAFNTGGIPDLIDHKINGYLAEYKNPEDLAEGIKFIIENNPENKLGKAARKKVIDNFSYPVVARKISEFYNNILNNKNS